MRDANATLENFLATLAHELRSPLGAMTYVSHVWQTSTDAAKLEVAHRMMERQITQLSSLVEDLLDASRIRSGKLGIRKARIDLVEVLNRAIETCRPEIHRREHDFSVALPSEPVMIDGDPTRLIQVFCNLLNNATKFTPEKGRICLWVETQQTEAVITVKDTGIGIMPEVLPQIFNLLTQADKPLDRSGGLGIGLAVAKELIALHGGTIEAKSQGDDHGTELIVHLPLAN